MQADDGGGEDVSFAGKYPADFFVADPPKTLPAWHLVGGKDLLGPEERTGEEPEDGYPVLLRDWIRTDGLTCLKVKLRGNDPVWDYDRIVRVGRIAAEEKVHPGLYKRRDGGVSLDTLQGPGFGYRVSEIERDLPDPIVSIP